MNHPFQNGLAGMRVCAIQMQENAAYILDELPNLQMPEPLRLQIVQACDSMIATKHDIYSTLADINDLLETDRETNEIQRRLERGLEWVLGELERLHNLVIALQNEADQDPGTAAAFILVAGSATNVLHAYRQANEALQNSKGRNR